MYKYSILTYVFDNKEILRDVPKDDNIEYVCVTNNKNLQSDVWKIIIDKDLNNLNPLYCSFYVRYHPFKYCSGNICIRIDGSIQIKQSLLDLFNEFDNSNNDICVMTNSRANNIFTELLYWPFVKNKKEQIDYYKNLGIDIKKEGCLQSPFSITRNNDLCNKCDSLCWYIINKFSDNGIMRPSQVAMTVAIQQIKDLKIMFVDESLIQSNIMQWCHHNISIKRQSLFIKQQKNFFEKPIIIYNFNDVYCVNDIVWR